MCWKSLHILMVQTFLTIICKSFVAITLQALNKKENNVFEWLSSQQEPSLNMLIWLVVNILNAAII
jgi:hypothetical protein